MPVESGMLFWIEQSMSGRWCASLARRPTRVCLYHRCCYSIGIHASSSDTKGIAVHCHSLVTMGIEEDLSAKIRELGEKIKAAKVEKKAQEEWQHFLDEMLALKVRVQRERE